MQPYQFRNGERRLRSADGGSGAAQRLPIDVWFLREAVTTAIPVYKERSKNFCELVRATEKVAYRGGVPAPASRGPNAAFVERPRDRFERGCACPSDCFDHRQKTGRELVGGGDLDLPAEGLPSLAPLAFFAANAAFVRSEISRRSFSARAA